MSAFRPDLLSPSTLKALAKAARKAAPEVLGHPIATHESQELIARILGQPNWHAALIVANEHAQAMDEENENEEILAVLPPTMVLRVSAENDQPLAVNMLFRFLQPVAEQDAAQQLNRLETEARLYLPHLAGFAKILGTMLATGNQRRMETTLEGMLLTLDRNLAPIFDQALVRGSWKDAVSAVVPKLPLLPSDIDQLRAVPGQTSPAWKAEHLIALIEDLAQGAQGGGDHVFTPDIFWRRHWALKNAGQPVPLFFSLVAERMASMGNRNIHDVLRGWTHLMAQQAPIFALSFQAALDHGHRNQNLKWALTQLQQSGALARSFETPAKDLTDDRGQGRRPRRSP